MLALARRVSGGQLTASSLPISSSVATLARLNEFHNAGPAKWTDTHAFDCNSLNLKNKRD